MREILFRGKRTDNGEWVHGDLLHLPHGIVILAIGYANVIGNIHDNPELLKGEEK